MPNRPAASAPRPKGGPSSRKARMVQNAMKEAKISAYVIAARRNVGNSFHNPKSEAIRLP